MCLAVPLHLVEKDGPEGVGEVDGVRRHIRLDFVPKAKLGDYVIVHAGFAIEILGEQQAQDNLKALREVADAL
jgi:hydrogenase expression/formation protein HypC